MSRPKVLDKRFGNAALQNHRNTYMARALALLRHTGINTSFITKGKIANQYRTTVQTRDFATLLDLNYILKTLQKLIFIRAKELVAYGIRAQGLTNQIKAP